MGLRLRQTISAFGFGACVGAGGVFVSTLLMGGSLGPGVRSQALQSAGLLGTMFAVGSIHRDELLGHLVSAQAEHGVRMRTQLSHEAQELPRALSEPRRVMQMSSALHAVSLRDMHVGSPPLLNSRAQLHALLSPPSCRPPTNAPGSHGTCTDTGLAQKALLSPQRRLGSPLKMSASASGSIGIGLSRSKASRSLSLALSEPTDSVAMGTRCPPPVGKAEARAGGAAQVGVLASALGLRWLEGSACVEAAFALLRQLPILAGLSIANLRTLSTKVKFRRCARYSALFREGSESEERGVWVILDGTAVLRMAGSGRMEQRLSAGDCCGGESLVSSLPRLATCEWLTPGVAMAIPIDRKLALTEQALRAVRSSLHTLLLLNSSFFDQLDDDAIRRIGRYVEHRVLREGEVVFHAADPVDALYLVLKGTVVLSSPGADGVHEHRLASADELMGAKALRAGLSYSEEAVAADANTLLLLLPCANLSVLTRVAPPLRQRLGPLVARQAFQHEPKAAHRARPKAMPPSEDSLSECSQLLDQLTWTRILART